MVDWETECRAAWDQMKKKQAHIKKLEAEVRAAFEAGWAGGIKLATYGYAMSLEEAWKRWQQDQATQ
jgi:hypothetical protein